MLEGFDINQVLGVAVAILVMSAFRRLMQTRFWSRIWSNAQKNLDDPNNGIDDAEKAVEAALLAEQRPTIQRVARSLRPSAAPQRALTDADDTPRIVK